MICKQSGLNRVDLEDMTIGMCLDFVELYIEMNNPKKRKSKAMRRATQADFDSF